MTTHTHTYLRTITLISCVCIRDGENYFHVVDDALALGQINKQKWKRREKNTYIAQCHHNNNLKRERKTGRKSYTEH